MRLRLSNPPAAPVILGSAEGAAHHRIRTATRATRIERASAPRGQPVVTSDHGERARESVLKQSAGTLLYRRTGTTIEVLIVKPSGPAARYGWSIPKGLPDPGESLEHAARRETREETGVEAAELRELGYIDYVKSKKRVVAFFGEAAPASAPKKTSWEVSE